jgi:solute carrier family 50 protein (sugar transporter)
VANVAGFFLGAAQLILYAIYWKPKSSKNTASKDSEHGSQHEHLLPSSSHFRENNEA